MRATGLDRGLLGRIGDAAGRFTAAWRERRRNRVGMAELRHAPDWLLDDIGLSRDMLNRPATQRQQAARPANLAAAEARPANRQPVSPGTPAGSPAIVWLARPSISRNAR